MFVRLTGPDGKVAFYGLEYLRKNVIVRIEDNPKGGSIIIISGSSNVIYAQEAPEEVVRLFEEAAAKIPAPSR